MTDHLADLTTAMNHLSMCPRPRTIGILDLPEEVIAEISKWLGPHLDDVPDWEFDGHICCSLAGDPSDERPDGTGRCKAHQHRLKFGASCKVIREYVVRSTLPYLRFYLCGQDLKGIYALTDVVRDATFAITLYKDRRQHFDHKRAFNIPDFIRHFRNLIDLDIAWSIFRTTDPLLAAFKTASDKAVAQRHTPRTGTTSPLIERLRLQMEGADSIVDKDNALQVEQLGYLLQQIDVSQLRMFQLAFADMIDLQRSAVTWQSLSEIIRIIAFPTLERLDFKIDIMLDGMAFEVDICDQIECVLGGFHNAPTLRRIKILLDMLDDPRQEPSIWMPDEQHDMTLFEAILPAASRLEALLNTSKNAFPQLTTFTLDHKPAGKQAVETHFVSDDVDACFTIHRENIRETKREHEQWAQEYAAGIWTTV